MNTPKKGGGRPAAYRLADGNKVPSVTRILAHVGDKEGMLYKAKLLWHEAGRRGLPFDRNRYWGDPESPTWGTDALEVGSVVHTWIEEHFHDEPHTQFDLDERELEQARGGFGAFLRWLDQTNATILETEIPLVSEAFHFCGTVDCVATVGGAPAILDWKTSRHTYPTYVAQIAAYRQLLRERDANETPDSAYLLRVGKESGDFTCYFWSSQTLDFGWRLFLSALDAFRALERVEKRLAS